MSGERWRQRGFLTRMFGNLVKRETAISGKAKEDEIRGDGRCFDGFINIPVGKGLLVEGGVEDIAACPRELSSIGGPNVDEKLDRINSSVEPQKKKWWRWTCPKQTKEREETPSGLLRRIVRNLRKRLRRKSATVNGSDGSKRSSTKSVGECTHDESLEDDDPPPIPPRLESLAVHQARHFACDNRLTSLISDLREISRRTTRKTAPMDPEWWNSKEQMLRLVRDVHFATSILAVFGNPIVEVLTAHNLLQFRISKFEMNATVVQLGLIQSATFRILQDMDNSGDDN